MSDTMSSPSYIQTVRLEPQAAPTATSGAIGWMRKNLFSSVLNAVLTVLAIALIVVVVIPLYNFAIGNAVLVGASGQACTTAAAGAHVGACWPFVTNRFWNFIYSTYPEAERWRVNLYFLLEIATFVWLLVPRIGGKGWALLNLLVVFPLLSLWLLTGGLGLTPVETSRWGGFLLTIVVATVGITASLPLGVLFALGRRSTMPVARYLSIAFIEYFRGIPLIVVLFLANIILRYFLPASWNPDTLLRALIGMSLFASAYMAEVIRGGIAAIPKGQFEGAQALGLKYWQSLAFIILPQGLKQAIPGIVNTFIAMFKDTTLVAAVAIPDLLATIISNSQSTDWLAPTVLYTGFIFAASIYWIFCFAMSRYSLWMERRLDTGHKR
jgi:general L-amino acid transport system permease protein